MYNPERLSDEIETDRWLSEKAKEPWPNAEEKAGGERQVRLGLEVVKLARD